MPESPAAHQDQLGATEWRRRQRGLFALIRAIVRRSSGEDVEDYKAHLNGRLDALTRLNAAAWASERIDLALIISEELLAHGAVEGEGLRIEGPPVALRIDDAQALGLAFQELATNAVKFGALIGGANVSVTWTIEMGVIRLEWRETGGASYPETLAPPGFGARWLMETLPYELDAEVKYTIDTNGVVCLVTFPLR